MQGDAQSRVEQDRCVGHCIVSSAAARERCGAGRTKAVLRVLVARRSPDARDHLRVAPGLSAWEARCCPLPAGTPAGVPRGTGRHCEHSRKTTQPLVPQRCRLEGTLGIFFDNRWGTHLASGNIFSA